MKYLWPGLRSIAFLLLSAIAGFAQSSAPSQSSKYREEMEKAQAAMQQRKYDEAAKHFKKAAKESAGDWEAQSSLVNALIKQADVKGAVQEGHKLLVLASDDHHRALAHNLVGVALYTHGKTSQLPEAEQEFRTAAQLDPSITSATFNLGCAILQQGRDSEGVEVLKKYVVLDSASTTAEEARKYIAKPALARSFMLADFTAPTPEGNTLQLSSLRGRVVLLDFWATWCPPCRAAIPEIQKISQRFPADRFVVVSVSIDDDKGAWQKFVAKQNMNWPQCRDADRKIYESARLEPAGKGLIPAYVLLDAEGVVLKRAVGSAGGSELLKQVDEVLKTAP